MPDFYIQRTLRKKDNESTPQSQVFTQEIPYKFIIILAEPGAGKTALLSSLANQYNTKRHRANVFKNKTAVDKQEVLIIDGFDEVSKLDGQSAIDNLLVKIDEQSPNIAILSSRASEWDSERNRGLICEYLEIKPEQIETFYLTPLDYEEQRLFFNHHCNNGDFKDFSDQLAKLDLHGLTNNPQFLKLFISAYRETKTFGSKAEVFANAVKHLAKEHNLEAPRFNRCSKDELIRFAEEIFAKLMLAGISGVSLSEQDQSDDFPYLFSLSQVTQQHLKQILDTGLFKQADNPNYYEPVHRIVAEYCVANYLVKRIKNTQDQLTLRRCLSIIAPNNVVRTELRGLLGWIACLGDELIQVEAINLDVYAVIANGDPSRLLPTSKHKLILALERLQKENPYFRASDSYRSFNAKSFITPDLAPQIKKLLLSEATGFHLKSLLLDLIKTLDTPNLFQEELIVLLLDNKQYPRIRNDAIRSLLTLQKSWNYQSVFQMLFERKENDDLEYAADIVEKLGVLSVGKDKVLALLKELTNLYPTSDEAKLNERVIGKRYFIKSLAQSFNLTDTEYFLDNLTKDIHCTCNAENEYKCTCKNGISKVISRLLDRYFELADNNYNIEKLALWLKDLRFSTKGYSIDTDLCASTLVNNSELRHAIYIQWIETGYFKDIYEKSYERLHAGLIFTLDDYQQLIIYAFDTNNTSLWELLFQSHNHYWYKSNKDDMKVLRRLLRAHANQKNDLMKIWAKDIAYRKNLRKNKANYRIRWRRKSRYERKQQERYAHNNSSLLANEALIKRGQHWGWLEFFSFNYLDNRKELLKYKDLDFIEDAISNGIELIEPELPSLEELAQDTIKCLTPNVIIMLYAIYFIFFKKSGALENLPKKHLKLLKAKANLHFQEITETERVEFTNEIDRALFQSEKDLEDFISHYVTPQFDNNNNHHVSLHWLLYKESWSSISIELCLYWLENYPYMDINNLKELFNYCIKHNQVKKLIPLIEKQASNCLVVDESFYGPPTDNQLQVRQFWLETAFFLTEDKENKVWNELKQEPNTIWIFYDIISPRGWNKEDWPSLSAEKIYKVLDYFIERCPPTEEQYAWSTDSTKEEKAYSTLVGLVKYIEKDNNNSVVVFDKLLSDPRFDNLSEPIRHHRYEANKRITLQNFTPPKIIDIVNFFDNNKIGSIEDLRAYIIEKLEDYQKELKGLETNPVEVFYQNGQHVDENTARNRVVDWLKPRLAPLDIHIDLEKSMSQQNRCDITVAFSLSGQTYLLVIEAKGQWHTELYTAASEQLHKCYSIHPNAADQGIYLVFWFSSNEKVAGRKNRNINNAQELKFSIESHMPSELKDKIDVFVLDVSKSD